MTPLTLAFAFLAPLAAAADAPGIIPAPGIPIYSGQTSVDLFMRYWKPEPQPPFVRPANDMPPELISILKRNNCFAMTDYLSWAVSESAPGVWDFAYYRENADAMHTAGIQYVPFCWLHFPPEWYRNSDKFVPYTNVATGETIEQMSLWSPDLPRVFDVYYGKLAEVLGDRVDFIRLAMPSEYGEIGYCSGMTNWLRPQPNAKTGYWCGDPHAREAFRVDMLAKHGGLESLNAAWGTSFAQPSDVAIPSWDAIAPLIAGSQQARRQWIDFVDWYNEAWVKCLETITTIVRKHFPGKEIIASLGYGSERACYGNDQSRHIEALRRLNLAAQTPGAIGFFATRRVSTVCRFLDVRYITEPPGDVPPDSQRQRFFMDLSNGVQTWFDYLPNMERSQDLFRDHGKQLQGRPPRTHTAVWHPTADHWLHPTADWSTPAISLSEALREAMDYEIVDDRMIVAGVLDKMEIHQLVLAGAEWLDAAAWRVVLDWVGRGNLLLVLQDTPIASVEGAVDLWDATTPAVIPDGLSLTTSHLDSVPEAYRVEVSHDEAMLTGVWYDAEPAIRWCAPGAGVILPMEAGMEYAVEVSGSLPPQAAALALKLDGKEKGIIIWPGSLDGASFTYKAPTSNDPIHWARLTLDGSGWVPSEVSSSPDTRRLGLYTRSVTVRLLGSTADPAAAPAPESTWAFDEAWTKGGKAIGAGMAITMDTSECRSAATAGLIRGLCETAGTRLGHPEWDAPHSDAAGNGLLCTLFDDAVIYYNPTASPRLLDKNLPGAAGGETPKEDITLAPLAFHFAPRR